MIFIFSIFVAGAIVFYNHYQQSNIAEAIAADIPKARRNCLVATDKVRMPTGGVVELLPTEEGLEIRTARWMPKGICRGTILLCQGYTEFLEKYDEVVEELLDRNFAIVTFDWRGQGLSSRLIRDPQKGHITSFADFIKDAELIYQKIVVPKMPAPYHIMGHSMGGHLAFRVLQEFPNHYTKAILCAPFFGWSPNFGAGKLNSMVVIIITNLMKAFGFSQAYAYGATPPSKAKTLPGQTSDRVRFQKRVRFYEVEPHLLMGGPTWNWILESTKSLALILQAKRIAKIQTPILLASGAKDEIVDPQSHHTIVAKSKKIRLVDFPTSMHEILMEQDGIRDTFWQEFDQFMGLKMMNEKFAER